MDILLNAAYVQDGLFYKLFWANSFINTFMLQFRLQDKMATT
jgi:hypothetical protein